jgi:DNA-binding beta-propeller fold protein YncE
MLEINVHLIFRLAAVTATTIAFALAPQLAHAQAPGSLAQLASPDNCIQVTGGGSPDCVSSAPGLRGSEDVAVSPDGKNVYVIGNGDDAISEFARNSAGTLTPLPSPNNCIADESDRASTTCSGNAIAVGLGGPGPVAIAISPDGSNVYVTGFDSEGNGDVAEFARSSTDGSLTPLFPGSCIAERTNSLSDCNDHDAVGLKGPAGIAVSPDGHNVYVADGAGKAITTFSRASTGVLSQGDDACITEHNDGNGDCATPGTGLDNVDAVVVSADGNNVYTGTLSTNINSGAIAEFSRGQDGALSQLGNGHDCIQDADHSSDCAEETGVGIHSIISLAVSPDGQNLYSSSSGADGSIAEFARGQDGALTQLGNANNCIEQQGSALGCDVDDGVGLDGAAEVEVSSDGASVYLATAEGKCCHAAIAEFSRSFDDGSLTQLPGPDNCIDASGHGCFNTNATGIGGGGLAISPDGANVYVTGDSDVAEFARTPAVHTLTVTVGGSGTGAVSDQPGAISCPTMCSNAYVANSQVTLAATPSAGSTFSGWSGACSGTGACQITMSADMQVTATFTTTAPPAAGAPTPVLTPAPSAVTDAGAPTPVLTAAPSAVTDAGAGFQGSVNPDGLATTVYFQYGLDLGYSQPGASGANYTNQTQPQSLGPDFSVHGIGPVAVSGLVPNALYHVRVVATNSAGTMFGQDITFTTARAPAPGAPTLGTTFNIAPVSGLVLVLVRGHLVPLTELKQIRPGVTIDTRHGTIELITAAGGGGGAHDAAEKGKKTQIGEFGGAVIRIRQTKFGPNKGMTTLMIVESAFKGAPTYATCKKPKKTAGDASVAAVSSKVLQLLHASANGKFKTSGRYAAATVRGTKWTIADRCDGTLTHDITDSLVVTDFVHHKTIVLHAGQSYLARGPHKKHR